MRRRKEARNAILVRKALASGVTVTDGEVLDYILKNYRLVARRR
jgi:hypothetical protein